MSFDITTSATLAEIMRTKGPDGKHMTAIDVLSEKLPMLEEGVWVQANDNTSHEFLQFTTEPAGSVREYNYGVAESIASTKPVKEQLMGLEARMGIDIRIADKAPDPIRYRVERERATFRGLVKTFHDHLFSKNSLGSTVVDPRFINGLGVRFPSLVTTGNAGLCLGAGGTGSAVLGSMWLIKHGPENFAFLFPKDMSRAIDEEDKGIEPVTDSSGRVYYKYVTTWSWEFGWMIGDPRSVHRLCNIAASGSAGAFNYLAEGALSSVAENALIDLLEALPQGDTSNCAIYAGPKVCAQVRKRINEKANTYFTEQTMWGRKMLSFMEVPIIRCDALAMDESTISA